MKALRLLGVAVMWLFILVGVVTSIMSTVQGTMFSICVGR
jgi:hypothetical protein